MCLFRYMSLRIFGQMARTQVHNFTLFRHNHEAFSAFTLPKVVWSLGLELNVEEAWPGGGSGEGGWSLGLGLDDEEAWPRRGSGEEF